MEGPDGRRIVTRDDTPDCVWEELYFRTKEVIVRYGDVVVYYVKARHPDDWETRIGDDARDWSVVDVMQNLVTERDSFEAQGADPKIFQCAQQLQKWLQTKPEMPEDRMEFWELASGFENSLLMKDLFPFKWDESRESEEFRLRKICGVFYTLRYRLDLPRRWFRHYAQLFKEVMEIKQKKINIRAILNRMLDRNKTSSDTDSDEEEVYVRHVLGKEPLEIVLDSIRKKRQRKDPQQTQGTTSQPPGVQTEPESSHAQEGNNEDVYNFDQLDADRD